MLGTGKSIYTYLFDGYWRDVGTVSSYPPQRRESAKGQ